MSRTSFASQVRRTRRFVAGFAAVSAVSVLMAGCASAREQPGPTSLPESARASQDTLQVIATAPPIDASVAYAGADPSQLTESPDFVAVVEGTIVNAEYTTSTASGGEDDPWRLTFPVTVATLEVMRASTELGGQLRVVMDGTYLPADVDIPGVTPDGVEDREGAFVEYPGFAGESPAKVGDRVVLFLTRTTGDRATLGDFRVLGAAYGTYFYDEAASEYTGADVDGLRERVLRTELLETAFAP